MSDEMMVSGQPMPDNVTNFKRPRRKRRTKAQMAEARALAGARSDGQAGAAQSIAQSGSALQEQPKPTDGVDPNHPAKDRTVRIIDADRGIVVGTRKKIAICGFASSSRGLVPVNDPEWEIWGLNQLYRHISRADRWFDIHWNWDQEVVPGTEGDGPTSYRGWLRDCGIPFYMVKRRADIPSSVTYPIDAMLHEYTDYFTSTIAFMLALAVHEIDTRVAAEMKDCKLKGFEAVREARRLYASYTIGIFGVDLVVGEEYDWQKSCAEFWIGAAALGRGITVAIPPQSALCKQQWRYGYQSEPESIIKISEIDKHGNALANQKADMIVKLHQLDGAMQADEYWKQLLQLRMRGASIEV